MNKQFSNTFFGVLLILFGVVLILNKLEIIYFTWTEIYPIGLIIISVWSFINVSKGNKNASFWGTVCGVLGIVFLLRNYDLIDYFLYIEIWPIILLAFGFGFLVLYIFNPEDWGVLIPGFILFFFGSFFLLESLSIDVDLFGFVFDFWPLILIIIGAGLILKTLSQKKTD